MTQTRLRLHLLRHNPLNMEQADITMALEIEQRTMLMAVILMGIVF